VNEQLPPSLPRAARSRALRATVAGILLPDGPRSVATGAVLLALGFVAACGSPTGQAGLPQETGSAASDAASAIPAPATGGAPTEAAGASPTSEAAVSGGTVEGSPPPIEEQVVELEPSIHALKGQKAPELTMTDVATGEQVSLADYAGRPVVVNFWATWCVPCRVEMPWLQAAADEYADKGLAVLLVDGGEKIAPELTESTISRFVDSMGLTVPVLYGDNTYAVQKDWTVVGLPTTFLVGPDGTVVDVRSGGYPNQATFEDHIAQILPEQ